MSGHTPGPWGRVDGYFVEADTPAGAVVICNTRNDTSPYDECRANARLIAAAPDLLAACEEALERILAVYRLKFGDESQANDEPVVQVLSAAIAKATGVTP